MYSTSNRREFSSCLVWISQEFEKFLISWLWSNGGRGCAASPAPEPQAGCVFHPSAPVLPSFTSQGSFSHPIRVHTAPLSPFSNVRACCAPILVAKVKLNDDFIKTRS